MCPEARRGWGQRETLEPDLGRVPTSKRVAGGEGGAGGGCREDFGDSDDLGCQGAMESLEPPREKRDKMSLGRKLSEFRWEG